MKYSPKFAPAFASIVAGAAVLLSAHHGTLDFMALLLFLVFLHPSFRRFALKMLRLTKGDCDSGRD